jgi:adenylate cyclase
MAYWNAPETDDEHVFHACRAALQAAAASRALAVRWEGRGRPVFRTRIGLHTGPAVVGNVGTRERMNYTLVGPVANQASRLEGLNKVYGTDVLASGDVMRAVAGRFLWRGIDRVVAAGTTETHDLYEPLAARDDPAAVAEFAGFLEHWDAARADYMAGRFADALAGFQAAAALRPDASSQPDGPCRVFIARCTDLQRTGTPADWDGIWRHNRK